MPALLNRMSIAPELLGDLGVHLLDRELLGDVDRQRQVARRALDQVDADDLRALALERLHGGGADAARRAGDHCDLAFETSRHYRFLPCCM